MTDGVEGRSTGRVPDRLVDHTVVIRVDLVESIAEALGQLVLRQLAVIALAEGQQPLDEPVAIAEPIAEPIAGRIRCRLAIRGRFAGWSVAGRPFSTRSRMRQSHCRVTVATTGSR